MKRRGVFQLPPGWDASPSQGYSPVLYSPIPILHLGREIHCKSKVSACPRTQSPLHDPVTWCLTWYGINYAGMRVTPWDFQNKGKSGWTGTSSFVLKVPLCNLRSSVIYAVPCARIVPITRPGLEPRPLVLESSALTIRGYLQQHNSTYKFYSLNIITSYTSFAVFPPFPPWQSADRPYLLYVSCAVRLERHRPPS